jgi:chromosome segregation ATPase
MNRADTQTDCYLYLFKTDFISKGRLGDLGTIDSKYDVAISTACKALDYIVVDTTATGEKCIDFLK